MFGGGRFPRVHRRSTVNNRWDTPPSVHESNGLQRLGNGNQIAPIEGGLFLRECLAGRRTTPPPIYNDLRSREEAVTGKIWDHHFDHSPRFAEGRGIFLKYACIWLRGFISDCSDVLHAKPHIFLFCFVGTNCEYHFPAVLLSL